MSITENELASLYPPDPPDSRVLARRDGPEPAAGEAADTTITLDVAAVRRAVEVHRPLAQIPPRDTAGWLDDPYAIEWALQLEQAEAVHFFDVVETVYERTAWLRARKVDEQAEAISDLERENAALRQELESLRGAVRELVSNVEDVYRITIPVMELARSGALMPFELS